MKTENFFKETIENYSNDDLNTLLINFDMYVYTDNNNRYLCLDDDKPILINEKCSLFYYYTKAIVFYKNNIEIQAQNELKRQINNLLTIK